MVLPVVTRGMMSVIVNSFSIWSVEQPYRFSFTVGGVVREIQLQRRYKQLSQARPPPTRPREPEPRRRPDHLPALPGRFELLAPEMILLLIQLRSGFS